MNQTVTSNLKRIRAARGLSQAELATLAGVSRQTINSIERGKYAPATEVSLRLAAILNCRVEDIFSLNNSAEEVDCVAAEPLQEGDRLLMGRVGGRVVAHKISGPRIAPDAFAAADGHARRDGASSFVSERDLEGTILLAGCDPSLSILAHFVGLRSKEHRVVPLHSPSEAALRELAVGMVHIAGSHLPGRGANEPNVSHARRALADGGGLIVTYASWEQGIVVGGGNPKGIRSLADLARSDVRIVNRDAGSGSRRLLDDGLAAVGVEFEGVRGYDVVVPTHMAIARAVQAGIADAGIALRAVAHPFDLDFVPLAEVRFDLVIPGAHMEDRGVRVLLDVLEGRNLRAELASLPGYDVSRTGATLIELKAA